MLKLEEKYLILHTKNRKLVPPYLLKPTQYLAGQNYVFSLRKIFCPFLKIKMCDFLVQK